MQPIYQASVRYSQHDRWEAKLEKVTSSGTELFVMRSMFSTKRAAINWVLTEKRYKIEKDQQNSTDWELVEEKAEVAA